LEDIFLENILNMCIMYGLSECMLEKIINYNDYFISYSYLNALSQIMV